MKFFEYLVEGKKENPGTKPATGKFAEIGKIEEVETKDKGFHFSKYARPAFAEKIAKVEKDGSSIEQELKGLFPVVGIVDVNAAIMLSFYFQSKGAKDIFQKVLSTLEGKGNYPTPLDKFVGGDGGAFEVAGDLFRAGYFNQSNQKCIAYFQTQSGSRVYEHKGAEDKLGLGKEANFGTLKTIVEKTLELSKHFKEIGSGEVASNSIPKEEQEFSEKVNKHIEEKSIAPAGTIIKLNLSKKSKGTEVTSVTVEGSRGSDTNTTSKARILIRGKIHGKQYEIYVYPTEGNLTTYFKDLFPNISTKKDDKELANEAEKEAISFVRDALEKKFETLPADKKSKFKSVSDFTKKMIDGNDAVKEAVKKEKAKILQGKLKAARENANNINYTLVKKLLVSDRFSNKDTELTPLEYTFQDKELSFTCYPTTRIAGEDKKFDFNNVNPAFYNALYKMFKDKIDKIDVINILGLTAKEATRGIEDLETFKPKSEEEVKKAKSTSHGTILSAVELLGKGEKENPFLEKTGRFTEVVIKSVKNGNIGLNAKNEPYMTINGTYNEIGKQHDKYFSAFFTLNAIDLAPLLDTFENGAAVVAYFKKTGEKLVKDRADMLKKDAKSTGKVKAVPFTTETLPKLRSGGKKAFVSSPRNSVLRAGNHFYVPGDDAELQNAVAKGPKAVQSQFVGSSVFNFVSKELAGKGGDD